MDPPRRSRWKPSTLGADNFQQLAERVIRVPLADQLAWVDAIAGFEHPLFHVQ
jgi:spore cortex formation protein SpoVR/YcgB (stage V sporulation)